MRAGGAGFSSWWCCGESWRGLTINLKQIEWAARPSPGWSRLDAWVAPGRAAASGAGRCRPPLWLSLRGSQERRQAASAGRILSRTEQSGGSFVRWSERYRYKFYREMLQLFWKPWSRTMIGDLGANRNWEMMKGGKSLSLASDFSNIERCMLNRGHDQKMWLRSSASSPHGHMGLSVKFLRKKLNTRLSWLLLMRENVVTWSLKRSLEWNHSLEELAKQLST